MRIGNLKAHFITMGSQSCYNASHMPRTGKARSIVHDPPLVFDISKDPGENHPIDPSTITVRESPIKLSPAKTGSGCAALVPALGAQTDEYMCCLLYTSPSPRD